MTPPTNSIYSTWLNVELVYEKKNRSLLFSGSRKIPNLGSIVQWLTQQASFPTGIEGPWVGIFLSPLYTYDRFYLSYIPEPTFGKDKKSNRCLLKDKWRHHHVKVTSLCPSFWEYKTDVLNGVKEKLSRIYVGLWQKNQTLVITVCRQSASLVMPMGDPRDGFFYPTLTLMMDPYIPILMTERYTEIGTGRNIFLYIWDTFLRQHAPTNGVSWKYII